jgi:hypothetical protein
VSTLNNGVERALGCLREAHYVLANLLEKDEIKLAEAKHNKQVVEAALRVANDANPHEDWFDRPPPTRSIKKPNTTHPILEWLNILVAQKVAIEDYGESIQNLQIENKLASQDTTGKGSAISFLPPRILEVKLNTRSHCTWCLSNINLLAPILVSVWKF